MLSVDDDKITLQKQVAELTEKSKDNDYMIKAKLQEKENLQRQISQFSG
jgi:hypothetical protein